MISSNFANAMRLTETWKIEKILKVYILVISESKPSYFIN